MKSLSKYWRSIPLLALLAFSSCDKYLDEKLYSQQFPGNFYTNAAEAEGALLGIISSYSGNFNYQLLNLEEYTTDNVLVDAARVLKADNNSQFPKKNVRSTNPLVESVYAGLYTSIYNCNAFIDNMERTKWPDNKDAQRPQFIAEAYTLRALAYFKLVRLFGPVPLVIDIKDNTPQGPLAIGRTPVEQVYAQIVSDLKKAKTLFTQEGPRSPGFASKIMARLMLAEVYLTMNGEPLKLGPQYLEAARAEADTLINAKAPGIVVPELQDFNYLFSVANENRGEIIFSEQNYGISTGQVWATGEFSYGALSFDLIREFDTSGPIDMNNPARQIRGVNPNTTAYDINQYTDPTKFVDGRFYPTFWPFKGQWNATTKKLPNFYDVFTYATTPSLYTSQTPNKTVFPGKFRSDYQYKGGDNAAYPHYDKKANVIIYRWAEAYLIYAEADNELNGPQSGAIAAVNKIRHRAALANLPAEQTDSKDHFRDAIRKERRLEFVDEGKRFYDLKRWGILIDKVNAFANEYNAYNPTDPMSLMEKGKHEVFPIPFSEIDRTHFDQNYGY
ncbi:RagB/SusD family nutrient uptake outer membrane protein [Pedobacter sp. BS3]|uniref:RagB/SusD family nutrient uptake outer membrane protein n=1 Tax=Pedobacter sp. BS3 TaxID=2567937 RepID=UPI0011EBF2F9|nr:RagB/SusD family nutrient uptake outer membrane protein [Pedobacter sp. BS3]TZF82617.1 RagB/SusD family nutrient uptake outer membrane protein [Pedobacter sp. BS3]